MDFVFSHGEGKRERERTHMKMAIIYQVGSYFAFNVCCVHVL